MLWRAGADWDERVLRARCRCEGDWRPGLRLRHRGGTAEGEEKWVLRITDGLGFTTRRDGLYLEALVRDANVWSSRPFFPHPRRAPSIPSATSLHACGTFICREETRRSPGTWPSATRSRSVRSRRSMSACIGSIAAMGGPWVARVFHEERSIERTESDAALLGYLAEADFPAERLACDNPVSVLDGQRVLVTLFVDGSAPGKVPARPAGCRSSRNVIQKDRVLMIVDWTGAGVGPRLVALARC